MEMYKCTGGKDRNGLRMKKRRGGEEKERQERGVEEVQVCVRVLDEARPKAGQGRAANPPFFRNG